MTTKSQIWKCEVCGNIVEVLHKGADSLVCCGQPMTLQEEKIEEEGAEKHKPVIEGNLIKVGSVEHPMEPEHHIEWIEAEHQEGDSTSKIFLKPEQKPGAEFSGQPKSARAYCNVHGLWKSE
jgi:superoxide reductase